MALPELEFDYKLFLDKSIILYGESGTGKSFLIKEIMFQLQPHIEQVIVVAPTDPQNNTYSSGIVPTPCIHYRLTPKFLDDVWERQEALSSVYKRANDLNILKALFNRVATENTVQVIRSINAKLESYKHELDNRTKIEEMEAECRRFILLIYKNTINSSRHLFDEAALSKQERFSLKYLNMNPRLLLVFDDCTDLLKKFKSHPVVQRLFYQGRWANITVIIACHTDKILDPEIKKNAFVNFYTEPSCARAFFKRDSASLDKEGQMAAMNACQSVFISSAPHQKLAWIREDKKFYRATAANHGEFRFGAQCLWDFCDRIKAAAGEAPSCNKFINSFNDV